MIWQIIRVFIVMVFICWSCGCTLQANGISSGKVGITNYELVVWTETHDIKVSASSPVVDKVVKLVIE